MCCLSSGLGGSLGGLRAADLTGLAHERAEHVSQLSVVHTEVSHNAVAHRVPFWNVAEKRYDIWQQYSTERFYLHQDIVKTVMCDCDDTLLV